MISTGNDIVALEAINITRTLQKKFYSKILSDTEIPLYNEFNLTGFPFEIFVWLLWSAKESAYKFLQRHNPALVFTPVRFVIQSVAIPAGFEIIPFDKECHESKGFSPGSCIGGMIKHHDQLLYFKSVINNQFITTVVNNTADFGQVYWGIKVINDHSAANQSEQVRLFAIERLKTLLGGNYRIEKNEGGCPVLFKGSAGVNIPVSFSHHEHFIGYSFILPA